MARIKALRPNYLDASALVKLVIDEEYSPRVRAFVFAPEQSWRVCTIYCFVEALGALKRQHAQGQLSERSYIAGSRRLVRLAKNDYIKLIEGDFPSAASFTEAEKMVKTHGIDFLDAFQLISVKGSWRYLASPSQPILVTADGKLSEAAEKEGLKCWYCRETHGPKC